MYRQLVHVAQTALETFEGDYALDGIQLTGYMAPNLDICVQDLQPVQRDCELLESPGWLSSVPVKV